MKKIKEEIKKPIEFEERFRDVFTTFKNTGTVSEYVYDASRDLLEVRPGHSLRYPYKVEKYFVEKGK